jgi:hydroxypyruvate reductase
LKFEFVSDFDIRHSILLSLMSSRTPTQLLTDLFAIWHAGVAAVRADRLVKDNLTLENDLLSVDGEVIDLAAVERIVVVGAGKACAGMAAGLEAVLGSACMARKQLSGWVNVPTSCVAPLERIHLHGARPPGLNEPTPEAVAGTEEILKLVASLGPDDLCIVLLSGGGSALLPAPAEGISLADKQAVTRFLSEAGANIAELNTVRKHLSRVKGGGLARHCTAGQMLTLIISDIMGDPLELIASGPTVHDSSTAADALAILEKFRSAPHVPESIYKLLKTEAKQSPHNHRLPICRVQNVVIGNIAVAVDAAGMEAERRGYSHAMHVAEQLEGAAEDVGRHLATMALRMRDEAGPDCLITGGEPTVRLAPPHVRGRGGRNQQLVLAALEHLLALGPASRRGPIAGLALLSGGTDGEDGPTDAAGAYIDASVVAAMQAHELAPGEFLRRSDAYHFFAPLDALLKTGPTNTNVCDLRVVVVDRVETRR